MALQSSGPISLGEIQAEMQIGSYSLRANSSAAGFSTPDSMSEFYGYNRYVPPTCYILSALDSGYLDYYDCSGNYTVGYFDFGDQVCGQSPISYNLYNTGTACIEQY
jgi:hypothetical protein